MQLLRHRVSAFSRCSLFSALRQLIIAYPSPSITWTLDFRSCPHGVVRPFLFDREGQANKPDGMVMKKAQGGAELAGMQYSINLATMDCTGCAVCVESCPDEALFMADFNEVAHDEVANWECVCHSKAGRLFQL